MNLSVGEILAIGGAMAGGLAWLLRLEAKVASIDQHRLADLASVRQAREADGMLNTERFNNIREALDDINEKLDGLQQMKGKVDQIRSFIVPSGTGK